MDVLLALLDILLHVDRHLAALVADYGNLTYFILAGIIFCETGLVVTPFLPGDSLLFAIGALAGVGMLDPWIVFGLLSCAAIAGDNTNYWLGRKVGPAVFVRETSRLLNRKHLFQAQAFYEKHGGKTIVIARFVPIIRTFAPFVAGIGRMRYARFLSYSLAGGVFWIGSLTAAGYFFGNLEWVKQNFTLVIYLIIALSLIPPVLEVLKARKRG